MTQRTVSQSSKNESMPYIRSIQNIQVVTERVDDLIAIVGPSTRVQTQRQTLYLEIAKVIIEQIPEATIIPYGSFQSHCYLFNSDIDFCCWIQDVNQQQTAKRVYDIFVNNTEISHLIHVDAEVQVVKFLYKGVGFDISFSQPSGVLTALFMEVLNQHIGKNHLLKRSLIFIQNYCANEAHVLGSHNFMLSSYSLRTMVIFILLHSEQICTPLQTLFAFLAYFSSFDFQNTVISIFGAVPKEQFDQFQTSQQFFDAQISQFMQKSFSQEHAGMIKKVHHLIALRLASDNQYLQDLGIKDCMHEYLRHYQEIVKNCQIELVDSGDKAIISIKQELFNYIDSQIEVSENLEFPILNGQINNAVQKFFGQSLIQKYFKDTKQQFLFRNVNICDPLLPSNNIGKTVSEASLKRMKRVFQLSYFNIKKLFSRMLDGHYTVAECVAEFDINFVNTLASIDVGELALSADHNFDVLKGDMKGLQNAVMGVIHQGLGIQSGTKIYCDK